RAGQAIVDVHEAAGLLAVAPDLDLVLTGQLGRRHLSGDRGGCLLAATVIGSVRPVDVVIPGDPRLDAEVVAEVAAHALGEQLLPAVPVLGHGRVGILFAQGGHRSVLLEVDVVHTG